MIDIFDLARTEGRQEGRTEVLQAMYHNLHKKLHHGGCSHDQALALIQEWQADGILTQSEAEEFSRRIG